jgi:hypothetical protein
VANGSSGWLIGVGGAIAGTVVGSLILKGLGLSVLGARLDALEKAHSDVAFRLARIEDILLDDQINRRRVSPK